MINRKSREKENDEKNQLVSDLKDYYIGIDLCSLNMETLRGFKQDLYKVVCKKLLSLSGH